VTLIVTQLSKFGIIHASDSNLTAGGNRAGESQKTFPVTYLNAGLTVAGAFSVAGTPMAAWMANFISAMDPQGGDLSLRGFADVLAARLELDMSAAEKQRGSLIHIAGYVESLGVHHPEFYFVRNVGGIDPDTGEYVGIGNRFGAEEQFWTRDCPKSHLLEAFENGTYQLYVNGFACGRMGYVCIQCHMNEFFINVWRQPGWKFRPPHSLAEAVVFVKLYMHIINALFEVSDYPAPFIGGSPQIYEIARPPTAVASC
jgi:hypothetical protein